MINLEIREKKRNESVLMDGVSNDGPRDGERREEMKCVLGDWW